jgi:hypothetical protein
MKKVLSHRFGYMLGLAILLGTHSCNCNPPTEEPTQPNTPLPQKGYWHTGTHQAGNMLKITAYPQNTVQKELYQRPWAIYRVTHDGSCGFRSFIPILLQDILVDNKWKDWLQELHKAIYQPAQEIIQQFNLADIDWNVDAADKPIKVHIHIHIGSQDETNALYKNTQALLHKLGTEAMPRPLQEDEIQLLVDFLRKCAIMKLIKSCHQSDSSNLASFKQNLGEQLAELRTNEGSTTVSNQFWANEDIFKIFINLYAIMFDINPFEGRNNPKVHTICYYYPTGRRQDGLAPLGPDPLGRKKRFEKKEDLPQPNIMMYHHDNIYFEYIATQP